MACAKNPRTCPPLQCGCLQAIHAREWPYRPHWPQAYATAAGKPLIVAILHTLAAHPCACKAPQRAKPPRQRELEAVDDSEAQRIAYSPANPDPSGHGYHGRRVTPDRKRAAANDRDD